MLEERIMEFTRNLSSRNVLHYILNEERVYSFISDLISKPA